MDANAMSKETPNRQWIVPADELADTPASSPWLIKNWLQQSALMMIHGASGCGKTFLVLDMCLHIASDATTWRGFPTKNAPVLYLAGEGRHGLGNRISAWKTLHKKSGTRLFVSRGACDLNTRGGVNLVKKEIESLQEAPELIVVDTLHRFLQGDENRAEDIKTMISACDELMRAFHCSVLFVHHNGLSKDTLNRGRGSSAMGAAMDIEMNLTRNNDDNLSLVQIKSKDSELSKSLSLSFKRVTIPNKKYDDDETPISSLVITPLEDQYEE